MLCELLTGTMNRRATQMRCPKAGVSFSRECKILFAAVVLLLLVFLLLVDRLWFKEMNEFEKTISFSHEFPIVLAWTNFFSSSLADVLEDKLGTCPRKCIYSSDKRLLNESAVVVFHVRNLDEVSLPKMAPHQVKVFFSMESPSNTKRSFLSDVPPDYFNATATYRADSDFPLAYGRFKPLDKEVDIANRVKDILSKKKKLAYQLASNCDTWSKREALTEDLARYINVTSYGKCFNRACDYRCETEASESHFFYFAFENSVCPDYVSEKFFRVSQGVVPVVLSRKVMEHTAPPGSFIAADDFASPQELAEYLVFVSRRPALYSSYFDWMKSFEVTSGDLGGCQLCEAAYSNWTGTVEDISQWWFDGRCLTDFAIKTLGVHVESSLWTFAQDLGYVLVVLVVFVVLFATEQH